MRQARDARLAIDVDVQVVLAEQVQLEPRHRLAEAIGPAPESRTLSLYPPISESRGRNSM